MADRRWIGGGVAVAVVAGIVLAARSLGSDAAVDMAAPASEAEGTAASPAPPAPPAPPAASTRDQGLRCIRGGTSREEVRTIMGEPDSIAFGDWLYGKSSVTFGYGTVLDYENAGNLIVCP